MAAMDFFVEVGGIFGRWLKKTFRRPSFVFFAMVQPIVWFLLFTQSFASIADIRQPTGVPGQFVTFRDLTGTDSYLTFFSAAVIGLLDSRSIRRRPAQSAWRMRATPTSPMRLPCRFRLTRPAAYGDPASAAAPTSVMPLRGMNRLRQRARPGQRARTINPVSPMPQPASCNL